MANGSLIHSHVSHEYPDAELAHRQAHYESNEDNGGGDERPNQAREPPWELLGYHAYPGGLSAAFVERTTKEHPV
jgi:hypothetical protein